MHLHTRRSMQGLTLVELMVALTLGLIVIGALVAVFFSSNQTYRQNEAIAGLQDNARFALELITRDLAMAGYWGGVRAVDAIDNVRVSAAARTAVARSSATGDCGPAGQTGNTYWLFDTAVPIEFHSYTDSLQTISNDFACLLPANLQPHSDVVMIRRVSGAAQAITSSAGTPTPVLVNNRFYVKTNRNIASLFRATSTSLDVAGPADCPDSTGVSEVCKPVSHPVQVYAYTPQIYYVRNYLYTDASGNPIRDGNTVLCRRYLNDIGTTPVMEEDCLAEGVESLQIEWGIGGDGLSPPANFSDTLSTSQVFSARTARVHLIVRAVGNGGQASADAKTFTFADLPPNFSPSPATGVLRRSFTTTVQLKNLQP